MNVCESAIPVDVSTPHYPLTHALNIEVPFVKDSESNPKTQQLLVHICPFLKDTASALCVGFKNEGCPLP